MYAIRSNTLRYPELFKNDFKGGSPGCPGALWTRVDGASGYPDVTAHALCGFLRLEGGFFFFFPQASKTFLRSFLILYQYNLILKVFHEHVASLSLKAISHALTGPISSRSTPSIKRCVFIVDNWTYQQNFDLVVQPTNIKKERKNGREFENMQLDGKKGTCVFLLHIASMPRIMHPDIWTRVNAENVSIRYV